MYTFADYIVVATSILAWFHILSRTTHAETEIAMLVIFAVMVLMFALDSV